MEKEVIMPPPLFRPGEKVVLKCPAKARLCLKPRGWKRAELPPGEYVIQEIYRDEEGWHVPEMSDGYTYRIVATINGKRYRFSIWQNDLIEAMVEECE